MAWHRRYVTSLQSASAGSGVRLSVEFRRKDLLWISPNEIFSPLTGENISLGEIRLSNTVSIGPNVLDVMKQEIIEIWEEEEITAADGSKYITKNLVKKRVWRLPPPDEFFALEDTAVKQPDSIKDATTRPRIIGWSQVWSASLVEFASISLYPAVDRRMVHRQSPLQHHLLQMAVAQAIPQVPPNAQQDDVRLGMTPFKRLLQVHRSGVGG